MVGKTVRFNGEWNEGCNGQRNFQIPLSVCSMNNASSVPPAARRPHSSSSRRCPSTPGSVVTNGESGPDGMYPRPSHWKKVGWKNSGRLHLEGLQDSKNGTGVSSMSANTGGLVVESMWANGMITNSGVLAAMAQPTLELTCRGHRGTVTGVCFQSRGCSASGLSFRHPQRVGAAGKEPPNVVSSGSDGAVTVWDPKISNYSYRNTTHRCPVLCCDASPRGEAVATGGHNGRTQLWIPNLRRTSTTYPASWSVPAGSMGDDDYYQWKAHAGGPTRALAFARDGTDVVYTGGDDKAVKCWDLNYLHGISGRRRGVNVLKKGMHGLDGEVCRIRSESSHGRSFNGNRFIGSFSTPTTSRLAGIVGHTNWIRTIAVQDAHTHSSYFHLLASGGDDQCAFLWDTRTYQCVDVLREPASSVLALSFHPAGYALATGEAAGIIHIYDLRRVQGGPVQTFQKGGGDGSSDINSRRAGYHQLVQRYGQAHTGPVNDVQFTPDGNWMISVGDDGLIHLWDVVEGHLYCAVQAHEGAVKSCRISDDGNFFATGGVDRLALVWQLRLPLHPHREDRMNGIDAVVQRWTATEDNGAAREEDNLQVVSHADPQPLHEFVGEMGGEVDDRTAVHSVLNDKKEFNEKMNEKGEAQRSKQAFNGPILRPQEELEDSPLPVRTTCDSASSGSRKQILGPHYSSFPPSEIQKRMKMHAAANTAAASPLSEKETDMSKGYQREESGATLSSTNSEDYRFRRSEERFDDQVFPLMKDTSDARQSSTVARHTFEEGGSFPIDRAGLSSGSKSSCKRMPEERVSEMDIENLCRTQNQMMKEIESLRELVETLAKHSNK